MTDSVQRSATQRYRSGWDELLAPLRPILDASGPTKVVLAVLLALVLWGTAIATIGVPALVWPMKLIVPGLILGLVALVWNL